MRSPKTQGGVIEHSPARATNFRIFISEFPNIAFYTTDAMVPGVNLAEMQADYATGQVYLSDNKVEFDQLTIGFIVDEFFNSYLEIYQYFIDYANPVGDREPVINKVDIDIQGLDNNKNPAILFQLKDCRPTTLGEITYDTQDEQNNQLVCDVTFRFDWMKVTKTSDVLPTGLDSVEGESVPG